MNSSPPSMKEGSLSRLQKRCADERIIRINCGILCHLMPNLSCAIPITEPDPESAVLQWFTLLGELCAAIDYDTAESIFADDVVSFGTRADIVTGLDNLRRNQWEGIWGNITEFKVATESVQGSGNQEVAWGVAIWTSTGFDEDHKPFHRPGRATVTLERRDGTWLATHTHFSLNPGTPSKTYGRG